MKTVTSDPTPVGFVPRLIAWALQRKPVRAFLLYSEHRGPMLADSITYRTLFSVFAGVLLGFSLASLWLAGNPAAWQALIGAVDSAIPGLVGKNGLIDPNSIEAPTALTVATVISLVGLLGAAIGAIGSLRAAMRTLADKVHDDVLFIWVLLRNLALAIGLGAALLASAAASMLTTAGIGVVTSWFGVPADDGLVVFGSRVASIVIVFALDAVVVAVMFRTLSGVKASARTLWPGALLGATGLTVLQQLSALFVGGATSNPLLATFAALIALLLWLNLSAQVILIASAYIITGVAEEADRVHARFGASTFAQRRVRQAERAVQVTSEELANAQAEEKRLREESTAKRSC